MSEDKQPVATPAEAAPEAQAEATSAPNTASDLDTFLSEFETQTKPAPAPQAAAADPATLAALKARLDERDRIDAERQNRADMESALKEIGSEIEIPDWAVLGYVNKRADSDPRINEVWNNRHRNPGAVAKLTKALRAELQKEHSKLFRSQTDANATEDRAAVTAAVKGASTNKAPPAPAPDYGSMSDAELAKEIAKLTR